MRILNMLKLAQTYRCITETSVKVDDRQIFGRIFGAYLHFVVSIFEYRICDDFFVISLTFLLKSVPKNIETDIINFVLFSSFIRFAIDRIRCMRVSNQIIAE